MKVEQNKEFVPIVITLENPFELFAFYETLDTGICYSTRGTAKREVMSTLKDKLEAIKKAVQQ